MHAEPMRFLERPERGGGEPPPGGTWPEPEPVAAGRGGGLAGSLIALLAAAAVLAFPVRGFMADPRPGVLLKSAWIAALLLGMIRPGWSAALVVIGVPLVPILPFLDDRVPQGVVHLLVASQALPLLIRIGARNRAWPNDGAWWLIVALLGAGAASVAVGFTGFWFAFPGAAAFAANLERALRWVVWELPSGHPESPLVALLTLTTALFAYLIVRTEASDPRRPVRLLRQLAAAALPVALFGGVQAVTRVGLRAPWAAYDPKIIRLNSTFSDPNALAAYLALLMPIAVGLAGAADARWRRFGWLAVAGVLAATEIATAGRMAYAATLGGLVVLAAGSARLGLDAIDPWAWVRAWYRRALGAAGGLALALLLAGITAGTWLDLRHADQTTYLHTALYTLNLRQPLEEKLKGRIEMWETALLAWRDHPVFGVGLGGMLRVFPTYNAKVGGFPPGTRLTAHSTFFNVAAEMGIAGLAVWLALLGVLLARAFARPPGGQRRHLAWLRLGLASGLVAYLLTMVTGDRAVLPEDPVLMLAAGAAAVGLAPPRAGLDRWARVAALALLAAVALSLPLRFHQALDDPGLVQARYGFRVEQADETGRPYQLTADVAFLHLPPSARVVTLPVRSMAPRPLRVRMTLDGAAADELIVSGGDWREVRFLLPPPARGQRFRRIGLVTSPPWQRPGDRSPLGVAVGEVIWSERRPGG